MRGTEVRGRGSILTEGNLVSDMTMGAIGVNV